MRRKDVPQPPSAGAVDPIEPSAVVVDTNTGEVVAELPGTPARGERKVFAHDGALAWLNAAVACGQNKERPALFRTVRIEFFKAGVQFIGCDGTMLFRTWAPYSDIGDLPAPMPEPEKEPVDAVTVKDFDQFALSFMKTLLGATAGENARILELVFCIDRVEAEQPALGAEVAKYVLTLTALGQRLSCQLYDGQFPAWRALQLGLQADEVVEGMTLAPKMFKAVGKLRGVVGVDCTFLGEAKAIEVKSVHGSVPFAGLLAPMRRPTDRQKPEPDEEDDDQLEHGEGEALAQETGTATDSQWDEKAPVSGDGADRVAAAAGV